MVQAILADVNCEGHVRRLVELLRTDWRREIWAFLGEPVKTFADVGLNPTDTDSVVWHKCQQESLILITGNRNEEDPDSLQAVIRAQNTSLSLPVITLADTDRILNDRRYAERAADKQLNYFVDIDRYRGAGRLYIP